MPLSDIQETLCGLYDLRVSCDVSDYVCDAEVVCLTAGESERDRGEVLVVVEDDEGLTLGLYVDPDALSRLGTNEGDAWFDDERRWALCLATEGVSHFLYLVFRAENDTSVSQLELELQAEVDKYASAVLGERGLAGNGVMTVQARTRGVPGGRELARSRAVRAQLFAGVRFLDGPDSPEGRRYRMAHRLAARYTAKLERRHLDHGDVPAFLHELRRFYRHGLREKLEAVR
jgi:hypothetical protein